MSLNPQQVIDSYLNRIKNKNSTEDLRAVIDNFVNKLTVYFTEAVIQLKFNFCNIVGAGEGT